jgi:putative SOS response-associated peptidase YedK
MCGRFALIVTGDDVVDYFGLSETPSLVPRYNIAPSQPLLCVGLSRDGKPAPALFRWGLVPGWGADAKRAPINPRADTAAEHHP